MNPNCLTMWTLFANGGGAAGDGGGAAPGGNLLISIMPFVAIGFLFWLLLIRPQKQEQSRRKAMLTGVRKNDRVVTIGGIYGVVTNVNREADEVTVRVDEANNTRLRVSLSAIARILGEDSSEQEPPSKESS